MNNINTNNMQATSPIERSIRNPSKPPTPKKNTQPQPTARVDKVIDVPVVGTFICIGPYTIRGGGGGGWRREWGGALCPIFPCNRNMT